MKKKESSCLKESLKKFLTTFKNYDIIFIQSKKRDI